MLLRRLSASSAEIDDEIADSTVIAATAATLLHTAPSNVLRQPQTLWIFALSAISVLTLALPNWKIFSDHAHYAPLHTVLELLAIAVALMVAALAWNLRRQPSNRNLILLGAGFFAVCLIDTGHLLAYVGMPDFVTPNNTDKAIKFWLAARYIAAFAFLSTLVQHQRQFSQPECLLLFMLAVAVAACVYWICLFQADLLPVLHIPGQGLTPVKISAEYLLAMLYLLAAVALMAFGYQSRNSDLMWLAAAAWAQALSELFFTRYVEVTDLSNCLGHIYKVVACTMVYRALFVAGVQRPYRELAFERSWLQALLAAIPDPVWLKDPDGNYLSCNRAFEQRFGTRANDLIGKSDYDLFPREQADMFRDHDHIALNAGWDMNEEWISTASGELRLFETTKATPRLEGDAVIGVLGIARDITQQKRIESELRLAAITFDSQEGIFIADADKVILRVNRAFCTITGYSAEEAIGKTPRLLKSGRHEQKFYDDLYQALADKGTWHGEIWNRRKNGDIYPEWLTITAVHGSDGALTHYVANLIDITERKAASDRITHLSLYDSLTQLPNRKLLFDRLGQAVRNSRRHGQQGALLMVDLDNFKTLNETAGHEAGDELLAEVAIRLSDCIGPGNTVARIGGDEFAVILEDLDRDGAGAVQTETRAREILALLGKPYRLKLPGGADREYQCSSSVGIALFGDNSDIDSAEELFKRADTAMYRAKALGRNSLCFFDPEMQAAVNAHAALEADLRRAIAERQLLLHYQPQLDSSGRIVGAEALIRWQHPQRGMVSPGAFIPLAEETGLIVPIGHWVLESACMQLATWSQQPAMTHLTLAVNVSAQQFDQANFVESVTALINRYAIPADNLKLELTESLLACNTDAVIGKMHALKALGVHFSLDDFGTGYSSLSYLKRLPLDQLKIDQSFVRDIVTDPNDAAIANTIIALGQTLGLAVIAEGVETQAQRDFLHAHGCRLFQGYLFSRPLPIADFEALARS